MSMCCDGVVVTLLAFDLGVLHKEDREIGVRESLLLSAGYISVALTFGAWVWWYLGAQSGMAYYTGFMIEKSLLGRDTHLVRSNDIHDGRW